MLVFIYFCVVQRCIWTWSCLKSWRPGEFNYHAPLPACVTQKLPTYLSLYHYSTCLTIQCRSLKMFSLAQVLVWCRFFFFIIFHLRYVYKSGFVKLPSRVQCTTPVMADIITVLSQNRPISYSYPSSFASLDAFLPSQ